VALEKKFVKTGRESLNQYCGSVTFCYGSVFGDPYQRVTDPDRQWLLSFKMALEKKSFFVFQDLLFTFRRYMHVHQSSKINSHKNFTFNSRYQGFSYVFA
jgi:hypothetical protein